MTTTQSTRALRLISLLPFVLLLTGCSSWFPEVNKAPSLTPIGANLKPKKMPIASVTTPRPVYRRGNSLWQDASADLFRDPRANKVGDVVTVKISIKDKASLDNQNNRSRDSSAELDVKFDSSIEASAYNPHLKNKVSGSLKPTTDAKTSSKSKGGISRSESIDLLIAAVVTGVLPNGNLIISGTQEVRVNFEVRVLSVAGIVRPRDISTNNSVSYDKIAEARISYGGKGRITEVQQPGWGQQIIDSIAPY
ncbi:MAG: flagellar basal body L-ring protein FlgH [Alphaproteobacteria bacterium]